MQTDFGSFTTTKAAKPAEEDDATAKDFLDAYKAYKRGHYKAAMDVGARALNVMAAEQGINGGGWA